uniref:Uncharacterized protein n=1 Tax=Chromera velia CCMP2878 TaxID=1169474 RepID=A0A0G4HPB2_9ALVE|eukprot:Cvel_7812.t1-p1 / transcript=Cvel_7812.t1 / gene=Cvel_7812 / organism=Chromera_velia_CCMP2878 / gene_product=hypothetical protein / transcript_product=hypothetical protein / location=Cvel_scaffold417:35572-37791(+) / protein_length=363 / sequence_SO=supercontig / SO=protein_coding / is_pseudo=false
MSDSDVDWLTDTDSDCVADDFRAYRGPDILVIPEPSVSGEHREKLEWSLPQFFSSLPQDDAAHILCRLGPLTHSLERFSVSGKWSDQGWGNQKSRLFLSLIRPLSSFSSASSAASLRPKAEANDSGREETDPTAQSETIKTSLASVSSSGRIAEAETETRGNWNSPLPPSPPSFERLVRIDLFGIAAHREREDEKTFSQDSDLVKALHPGDFLQIEFTVGGGGGHEIHVKELKLIGTCDLWSRAGWLVRLLVLLETGRASVREPEWVHDTDPAELKSKSLSELADWIGSRAAPSGDLRLLSLLRRLVKVTRRGSDSEPSKSFSGGGCGKGESMTSSENGKSSMKAREGLQLQSRPARLVVSFF